MNDYQNMYQETTPEGAVTVTAVQTREPVTYTSTERIAAVVMYVLGLPLFTALRAVFQPEPGPEFGPDDMPPRRDPRRR